jgi:hypothetical protein
MPSYSHALLSYRYCFSVLVYRQERYRMKKMRRPIALTGGKLREMRTKTRRDTEES